MGAIALAEAAQLLCKLSYNNIEDYEHYLVKRTFNELNNLSDIKFYVDEKLLGSVIPFDIKGFESKLTAEILADYYGIGVRSGSFCVYEFLRKLKGISRQEDFKISREIDEEITVNIPRLVRASFGLSNSIEDVDRFVDAIKDMVKKGPKYYIDNYYKNEKSGEWILK